MDTPVSPIGSVFPAQPSWETQRDDPYRNVQRKIGGGETVAPGQEFKGALSQMDQTATALKGAGDKAVGVQKDIAATEFEGAKQNVAVYDAVDAERKAAHAALAPEVAKRMEQTKADIEEWRAKDAPALFNDRSAVGNLALAISLAGAAVSDAMAAKAAALLGKAAGPSAVTAIINMDIERQREKLKRASDKMAQSKDREAEVRVYQDRLDKRLDAKKLVLLEKAQVTLLMNLKGKGMDLAQAQGDKENLALQMEIDKTKAGLVQGLVDKTAKAETVTNDMGGQTKTINREPTAKSPTEKLPSVQQSAQFNRMKAGGETLERLLDDGKGAGLSPTERKSIYDVMAQDTMWERNPSGAFVWQEVTGDRLGNMTPKAREAMFALTEAVDAQTGITTGAVATKDQVQQKMRRWLPGFDAKKADVDTAKRAIRQDIEEIYAPAAAPPPRVGATAPAPVSAAASKSTTATAKKPAAKAAIWSDADKAEARAALMDPKSDDEDRKAAIKILDGERL